MSQHNRKHPSALGRLLRLIPVNAWVAAFAVAIVAVAVVVLVMWVRRSNEVTTARVEHTTITPMQVRSIERIGQWEFLAVSDEEIVDTVNRGFFGDSELIRIYYGTLRLGIDLTHARPGWITMDGDTLRAVLPPITLLSPDFIDEARTRTFYEDGKWTPADRKQLYLRAQRAMSRRVMSRENIESARRTALAQVDKLLRGMGFDKISIRFEERAAR